MNKSRTAKATAAWLHDHINDPYVKKANAEGYRSRAAYKLMEIDDKDKLLKPGSVVVELGAAPGSWSQVIVKRIGKQGKVFALDLLEMEPVVGVDFLQGDFTEEDVLHELERRLEGRPVDLVVSDMAPNLSGIASSDQARSIYLSELALDFAIQHLKPGGHFLIKVFQGTGFMEYRQSLTPHFRSVVARKPQASRDRSAEVYLLGVGRKA